MSGADESEEVDRHVLKRYEVGQKLGKGVRASIFFYLLYARFDEHGRVVANHLNSMLQGLLWMAVAW
jgi:hypothetical protein